MAKSPWFKFYASDFLLDSKVDSLPLEAQAILIRMWSVIWIDGSIPCDPKIISRLCRVDVLQVQKNMQTLMQMFHKDVNGFLFSLRMDEEREKSSKISNVRRLAAESKHSKRHTELAHANDDAKVPANGHAKEMQSESESDITTPLTPQGGNTVGLTVTKKKRRSREEIFSPYSPETKNPRKRNSENLATYQTRKQVPDQSRHPPLGKSARRTTPHPELNQRIAHRSRTPLLGRAQRLPSRSRVFLWAREKWRASVEGLRSDGVP
jgi:uncharacterized protein YdaU (DUF1376 family)